MCSGNAMYTYSLWLMVWRDLHVAIALVLLPSLQPYWIDHFWEGALTSWWKQHNSSENHRLAWTQAIGESTIEPVERIPVWCLQMFALIYGSHDGQSDWHWLGMDSCCCFHWLDHVRRMRMREHKWGPAKNVAFYVRVIILLFPNSSWKLWRTFWLWVVAIALFD